MGLLGGPINIRGRSSEPVAPTHRSSSIYCQGLPRRPHNGHSSRQAQPQPPVPRVTYFARTHSYRRRCEENWPAGLASNLACQTHSASVQNPDSTSLSDLPDTLTTKLPQKVDQQATLTSPSSQLAEIRLSAFSAEDTEAKLESKAEATLSRLLGVRTGTLRKRHLFGLERRSEGFRNLLQELRGGQTEFVFGDEWHGRLYQASSARLTYHSDETVYEFPQKWNVTRLAEYLQVEFGHNRDDVLRLLPKLAQHDNIEGIDCANIIQGYFWLKERYGSICRRVPPSLRFLCNQNQRGIDGLICQNRFNMELICKKVASADYSIIVSQICAVLELAVEARDFKWAGSFCERISTIDKGRVIPFLNNISEHGKEAKHLSDLFATIIHITCRRMKARTEQDSLQCLEEAVTLLSMFLSVTKLEFSPTLFAAIIPRLFGIEIGILFILVCSEGRLKVSDMRCKAIYSALVSQAESLLGMDAPEIHATAYTVELYIAVLIFLSYKRFSRALEPLMVEVMRFYQFIDRTRVWVKGASIAGMEQACKVWTRCQT